MVRKVSFVILFLVCLLPFIDAPIALVLGVIFALCFGNPFSSLSQKASKLLLKLSIIGLGFGMNLFSCRIWERWFFIHHGINSGDHGFRLAFG